MAKLGNPSFINDFHIWPLFIGDFHGFSDCHVWLLEGKPGSQVSKAATVRLKNKNGLEAFQKPAPNIFSDLKALYIDMFHPFSSPLPCLGKLIDTNVWICVAMCWNAKSVVLGLEKNMFCYFCSMERPGNSRKSYSFVPIDFRPSAVGKRPHQIPSMGELGVLLDYETQTACDAKVIVSGISGMGSWMSSL